MLISVDPGLATGLAFRFDNGQWATMTAPHAPKEDERLHFVVSTLLPYMQAHECTAVITESFLSTSGLSRYGNETVELIGAIKVLCYLYVIPLVKQPPGLRYRFEGMALSMINERVSALKLSTSDHQLRHERSALAHLLLYEHGSGSGSGSSEVEQIDTSAPPISMTIKPQPQPQKKRK
jgi:hypothetical protein